MKKVKVLSLILIVLTVFFAFGVSSSAASTDTFRSSPSTTEYVELKISGSKMTVTGIIKYDNLSIVAVIRSDGVNAGYGNAESGQQFSFECDLSSFSSNTIIWIGLGVRKSEGNGYNVTSYTTDRIVVSKTSSGYALLQSKELAANNSFKISSLNPSLYRGIEYSDAIKKQADAVVKGCSTDYEKLFAIHKWVADNIYYDYDYLYGSKSTTCYKADEVLQNRYTVCQGYAELMLAMCSSQNIPCVMVESYALGVGLTDSTSSFALAACTATEANHATVAAYVSGRWVNCDPTWDSRNTLLNGKMTAGTSNGYYHFDISDEAFALDHKITKVHETTSKECSHSWDSGKTVKNATCKENGAIEYTCSLCGMTKTETTAKTDHSYSGKYSSDENNHWRECTVCSAHTDEGAHSWKKEVTKEATTKENGIITYTCTVCGLTKTEKTDKLPAETEPPETKPAETQPSETEPTETEPAETKPVETEPIETQSAETQPAETESSDTTPAKNEKQTEAETELVTEAEPDTDVVTDEEANASDTEQTSSDVEISESEDESTVTDAEEVTDNTDDSAENSGSNVYIIVIAALCGAAVIVAVIYFTTGKKG